MKHPKYHPRDIYPEWPLRMASFSWMKRAEQLCLRRSQMLTFSFYCQHHNWEGEPKLCVSSFFAVSLGIEMPM